MRKPITITPGLRQPVLAGFHLGIIRLTGTNFGGAGLERVLALIRDPAIAAQASARAAAADSARAGRR